MSLIKRLDSWLENSYDDIPDKGLSLFRIIYCLYILFFGVRQYSPKIKSYSLDLYDPPLSLASFFELPPNIFFVVIDYGIVILVPFVLFGLFTKPTSFLLGICFLVGNTFLYSFGKISHGKLLLMLIPLLFAFSNWESNYSIDSKRKSIGSPRYYLVGLYAILIGLAMFSAGLEKVTGGWLNTSYSAVRYTILRRVVYAEYGFLSEWILSVSSRIFWEFIDYSVVFFEVFFV